MAPHHAHPACRLPNGLRAARGTFTRTRDPRDDPRESSPGVQSQLGPRATLHGLLLPDPHRDPRRVSIRLAACEACPDRPPAGAGQSGPRSDREPALRAQRRAAWGSAHDGGSTAARRTRIPDRVEYLVPDTRGPEPRAAQGPARDHRGGRRRRCDADRDSHQHAQAARQLVLIPSAAARIGGLNSSRCRFSAGSVNRRLKPVPAASGWPWPTKSTGGPPAPGG